MRTILTFMLSLTFFSASAQEAPFDFRKVRWNMTLNEVQATENGQTLRYANSDMLQYSSVKLSTGELVDITYFFDSKAKQLFKVMLLVFGDDTPEARGTCDHIIPFSERVTLKKSIVNSLFDQELKCTEGWYVTQNGKPTEYPLGKGNCSLDNNSLAKLEVRAMEAGVAQQEASSGLIMANDRVRVDLTFNAYDLKTKDTFMYEDEPCDINFYNTYFTIVYAPSEALIEKWRKEGK